MRWLQEYSLSLGIVFCDASFVFIQDRLPMLVLLGAGVALLGASMVAAVMGPPPHT